MKRLDLVRIIEKGGAVFIRHGSDHDWYQNPTTGIFESVPRHREIDKILSKKLFAVFQWITKNLETPHNVALRVRPIRAF